MKVDVARQKLSYFINHHKELFLAVLLFAIVVAVYLFSCPSWFFDGEDYGLILRASQCTSLKDFFDFFIHGNICNLSSSFIIDHLQPENLTTVNMYYRPLLPVMYALELKLFGLSAYSYFVLTVIMHALNASIIMYIISLITHTLALSFICSLFFSFHQFLYGWLGKIDTQQHQFSLFLMLLALLFLIKNLQRPHAITEYLIYVSFLASLLTRETFLVLPAIIILAVILNGAAPSPSISRYGRRLFIGSSIITLLYITMRTITCNHTSLLRLPLLTNATNLFEQANYHTVKFLHFMYDLFWSQWFPWSTFDFFYFHNMLTLYRIIKIIIGTTVVTLFITNTHKKLIVFALSSALLLLWPLFLIPYGGYRFFYETLPFFVVALACLIHFSAITKNKIIRQCVYGSLIVSISINCVHVIKSMHKIMETPQKITAALHNFRSFVGTTHPNTPLFIFNASSPITATGLIQAIQLYDIGKTPPSYFFAGLTIITDLNAEKACALIDVTKTNNSLCFASRNPALVSFSLLPDEQLMQEQKHFYIEQITIYNQTEKEIYNLELKFKSGFYSPMMKIFAFFLSEQRFVALNAHTSDSA